jgi:hypothetical protein
MGEGLSLHDVLRYLLERVPHSTQDEHDRIAAAIDDNERGGQVPDEPDEPPAPKKTAKSTKEDQK